MYAVNLQTRTAALNTAWSEGQSADASSDGNFVAIGGYSCLYSVTSSSFTLNSSFPVTANGAGIAISGDANIIGLNQIFADASLTISGSIAHPTALYGNNQNWSYPVGLLLYPRLNAAGSLFFLAFPDHFEIVDVAHATLRMRFSLTETIQYTITPLAIDSGGRYIFLITDKGLTVVDLGAALLSIGHLSQQNAAPGTQVVVRGSGFDASTTAKVGGVTATVVFTDENTLTLTIPNAASGPEDIMLTRSDGETYTLENGVVLP